MKRTVKVTVRMTERDLDLLDRFRATQTVEPCRARTIVALMREALSARRVPERPRRTGAKRAEQP